MHTLIRVAKKGECAGMHTGHLRIRKVRIRESVALVAMPEERLGRSFCVSSFLVPFLPQFQRRYPSFAKTLPLLGNLRSVFSLMNHGHDGSTLGVHVHAMPVIEAHLINAVTKQGAVEMCFIAMII